MWVIELEEKFLVIITNQNVWVIFFSHYFFWVGGGGNLTHFVSYIQTVANHTHVNYVSNSFFLFYHFGKFIPTYLAQLPKGLLKP